MLAKLNSRQLAECMAFAKSEPFGEKRADLRSGIFAATMANAWRGKGSRAAKVTDFMPNFEPPKKLSWQAMKKFMVDMVKKK